MFITITILSVTLGAIISSILSPSDDSVHYDQLNNNRNIMSMGRTLNHARNVGV